MQVSKTLTALSLGLLIALPLGLTACGKEKAEKPQPSQVAQAGEKPKGSLGASEKSETATPYVRLDVRNMGSIVVELAPTAAPATVANFQKLVGEGFYENLGFHRAVPGFVIQGGDPKGDGTGGSSETITGEFLSNGHFNPLKHKRGVISMARSANPNSASSQFFIVLNSRAGSALNDKYASFGQVIYGMETVDKIAGLPAVDERIQDQPKIEAAYFITEKAAEEARKLELQEAEGKDGK